MHEISLFSLWPRFRMPKLVRILQATIFISFKTQWGFKYSSLHYIIFLSFFSFSYNGVCSDWLKLSFSDVIVVQKSSNGDGKITFYG